MKIVCEACGAKYSIADDRVAGKVFKIRCKRCSEVIVVRGDQPEQAAAQPAAAAYDDQSAIWHVVVDGEQAGPYAPSQLGEMLTAGTVDWEAYVWAEGFDNWVPMRDVPDLVAQITGQEPAHSAAAEPAYRAASSATLTGQPSMGADPFADDRDGGGGGGFGQQSVAGPDLFAASQEIASPFASAASSRQDAGVVASAPSPRMSAERVMTGARNENSVLFSLKNLQALATGPSVPPASTAMPERGGGFAGGEGSGLIDIRALATTTGVGGGERGGARDELLSMGAQGGAFGALGSPMLGAGADDGGGDKKTYVWAAVAAVGLLATAGVAIAYILIRPAPSAPTTAVAVTATPATTAAPGPAAAPAPGATGAAPTEGELAAREAAKHSEEGSTGSSHSSGEHHHKRENEAESKTGASPSEPSAPAAAAAPSKPSKPSGPRTIDDLLDNALNGTGGGKKPAEAAGPNPDLPKSPSRDQVMAALNAIKADVASCGKGGSGGVATVAVSVAGSTGRVTNAQVNGVTGPAGSCVAQAVRKAVFPKFQSNVFKVTFPFKLSP